MYGIPLHRRRNIGNLRNTLDVVTVKWLWINEQRKNIFKFIQLNRVELITLHLMDFEERHLCELFKITTQAANYIEVLENKDTSTPGIEFWTDLERELHNESVHVHGMV
ncbi:hypothetical protein PRIPAC_77698 [Pristionchus pacificus]|uniref:Uncharacterized protein n=1 Tax=Pristionchus pacificus TaxID=54126 RepID=A0A2A6BHI2_PRIPA|nr:hypothetical protein PRIPAC_77698 [Pristionchus pacificus]|eukprot:PDM65349.1 hypothetical protein PRIPAC_52291 [Pristionchus pacificus]